MDEERKEGLEAERRRVRFNPQAPGNILSNITEPRADTKADSEVGAADQ